MSHKLSAILNWLDLKILGEDFEVAGLCLDSRKINHGDVFVALSGSENHGMDFAYQAQRGGARAILAEKAKDDKAVPKSRQQELDIQVYEVENLSDKLGMMAARFYAYPARQLKITGITGTNGKTSSAWLLLQLWNSFGIKGGYIGTLGYGTLKQMYPLANTTPTALELQKILAEFTSQGISHVALEVSSHGIYFGRINEIDFDSVALTNISRDHLDFHKTLEDYASVKKRLFTEYKSEKVILNCKEPYSEKWLPDIKSSITRYGTECDGTGVIASNVRLLPTGMEFNLHWDNEKYKVKSHLLGHFNVDNTLLAVSVLLNQGFDIKDIIKKISLLKPVPGRMNCIDNSEIDGNFPLVIVDYAHTPDALEQVLKALKQHNARKIWCVFGCGGNRDKGKRPQMGYIAEVYADEVVVTDDNPRYENPSQIIKDILMGMESNPQVIHSRRDAIAYAIENAHADDLILIAGKGHENYQLIEGNKYSFDDMNVSREILMGLSEKCA